MEFARCKSCCQYGLTNLFPDGKLNDMSKERLIAYIQRHAATQEEFAVAINMSPGYLSQLLSGKRPMTWTAAKKISAVTKIAPARLMEMREDNSPVA